MAISPPYCVVMCSLSIAASTIQRESTEADKIS